MVETSDGFSSPARTADVQFREIDSEFLKQQARIWLEAVLDERFDEEITLADVLVDGAILDRISAKILSLLFRYPEGEPVSPKSFIVESPLNVKHSGKYLPYSNVDSFLKVCKKLGLTGVDLFSPPDVIEKKDIRKVCLCIRALSKKARMKHFDVPEFDSVSHTVAAMPTEFVGGIRESLSQSSSPSGSRNMENKERLDKLGSSPSRFNGPIMHTECSFLESLENVLKEQKCAAMFDENDDEGHAFIANTNNDSTIDRRMPSTGDEDSTSTRRLLFFSNDERTPSVSYFSKRSMKATNLQSDTVESGSHEDISYRTKDSIETCSAEGNYLQCQSADMTTGSTDLGQSDGKSAKKGVWLSLVAIGVTLVGAFLSQRSREPSTYEVKKGDTLSGIAKRAGKSKWEDIVTLNPGIQNPDLIYPNEKLRL